MQSGRDDLLRLNEDCCDTSNPERDYEFAKYPSNLGTAK